MFKDLKNCINKNIKIYMVVAVVLIAGGTLGLMYDHFSFTKETHETSLGPVDMTFNEKQTVNIPTWASVASIIAGSGLLVGYFYQKNK